MAGMFSACTSEELIENGGAKDGMDTSVSLVLATGDPVTKAATGYNYATEDEIKVSNCVVALFKMDGSTVGDMIGDVKAYTFETSNATYEGKPAYSLTGIPAKTGTVRILVIANANNADYARFRTWSEFMGATIQKEFVENDLVKVNFIDKELVAPVTETIAVPLSQLSAKVKLNITTSDPSWTYTVSKITVDKVNKKSDLILTDLNSEKVLEPLVLDGTTNAERFADQSFYTYENPLSEPVKITIEGTLTETNGVPETKKYSIELNKTIDNAKLAQGLCHGTLYNITGNIDVKTRLINFNWEILPWSTTVREVSVDIIKPKFLVVKDTEMTMPNVTSISTTFSSSSPVRISNIVVTNGTRYVNIESTITPSAGNNGDITIKSELPINFVPKYISFTVTNEDGLSQQVKIEQYPPLYIYNYVSKNDADAGDGQTNSNMYVFKSLVADYTSVKDPLEVSEDWRKFGTFWGNPIYKHMGEESDRLNKGANMAKYIRDHAVLGYPEMENVELGTVSSIKDGDDVNNVYVGTVPCTKQDAVNNYRISPHFMLASQNGANSGMDNKEARKLCAGYVEHDRNGFFTDHKYGSWRVATKAELFLIDILQNTTECDVKEILEGRFYNCAIPEFADFMDPRVNQNDNGTRAVRCVRDIK